MYMLPMFVEAFSKYSVDTKNKMHIPLVLRGTRCAFFLFFRGFWYQKFPKRRTLIFCNNLFQLKFNSLFFVVVLIKTEFNEGK